jgi:hypothetical protein
MDLDSVRDIEVNNMNIAERIFETVKSLPEQQAAEVCVNGDIGKSLNHKSSSATGIYARLGLDPVRESVNRATSAIMAAAAVLKPTAEVVEIKQNSG